MPAQQRIWLDNEQRLLPGTEFVCQQDQQEPITLVWQRAADAAAQDKHLLSQESIFRHEVYFAACHIADHTQY